MQRDSRIESFLQDRFDALAVKALNAFGENARADLHELARLRLVQQVTHTQVNKMHDATAEEEFSTVSEGLAQARKVFMQTYGGPSLKEALQEFISSVADAWRTSEWQAVEKKTEENIALFLQLHSDAISAPFVATLVDQKSASAELRELNYMVLRVSEIGRVANDNGTVFLQACGVQDNAIERFLEKHKIDDDMPLEVHFYMCANAFSRWKFLREECTVVAAAIDSAQERMLVQMLGAFLLPESHYKVPTPAEINAGAGLSSGLAQLKDHAALVAAKWQERTNR